MHIEIIQPTKKKTNKRALSWTIIRITITISILTYLGSKINWTVLSKQFMQSDPLWLLTACLLLGISFLFASIRWWCLLKVQDIFLPFKTVAALTLIGQFFNAFLLGTTGGDVIKILYVLKYAPSKKTCAMLSIIMDRALGLFILLFIALAALPWHLGLLMKSNDTKNIVYALLIIFGFMLVGAATFAFIPFKSLPFFPHKLWQKISRHDIIESLIAGFRQHGQSKYLTLKAILCSFSLFLFLFTAGYSIARAIHLDVTYIQILIILSVVTCVISLPISIGGNGIREGAFVIMFAAFGVITIDRQTGGGQEPAILFSILFFALFSVWSLLGGLVYLIFQHDYAKSDTGGSTE